MLSPCLIFLDRDGPADPLIARERRYVFPGRQCLRVGRERTSEISRKVMYDSSGDSNGRHRVISQAKGQASDTRVQLGFRDYRNLSVPNPASRCWRPLEDQKSGWRRMAAIRPELGNLPANRSISTSARTVSRSLKIAKSRSSDPRVPGVSVIGIDRTLSAAEFLDVVRHCDMHQVF